MLFYFHSRGTFSSFLSWAVVDLDVIVSIAFMQSVVGMVDCCSERCIDIVSPVNPSESAWDDITQSHSTKDTYQQLKVQQIV